MLIEVQQAADSALYPLDLTVADWAEEFRIIPPGNAQPGPWRHETTPYLREIMVACSDLDVSDVVMKACAQSGKTEVLLNTAGYYIHLDPSRILMVGPSIDFVENWSAERLAPMLRATPALSALIPETKENDKRRRKIFKSAAMIALEGANAPAGLSSRPVRVIVADEIDRFPQSSGKEGSPLLLARKRTTTFWNARHIWASTPTIEGQSHIDALYQASTMEQWHVPCPNPGCGHPQPLSWDRIDFKSLTHQCECCSKRYDQHDWLKSSQNGEWVASRTHDDDGNPIRVRGFHLTALISPWVQWSEIVKQFLDAHATLKAGDPTRMIVWKNTVMGEVWKLEGGRADEDRLINEHRDFYGECEVPDSCVLLTAGVDIQGDRLEYSVYGWGRDQECWLIEHGKIMHGPTDPMAWSELDRRLTNKHYRYADSATIQVRKIFVDSGYSASNVYDYTRRKGWRVSASKGVPGFGRAFVEASTASGIESDKTRLMLIGVDSIKENLVTKLSIRERGAGFTHFPCGPDGEERSGATTEFFKSLCAEQRVLKFVDGFPKYTWTKKAHQGNESWDCFVYAFAAFDACHVDPNTMRRPPAPGTHVEERKLRHEQNGAPKYQPIIQPERKVINTDPAAQPEQKTVPRWLKNKRGPNSTLIR